MAAYDLEEQEQLSTIKAWWEQNGNKVTGVLLVAALASAGFQGWRWYQNTQATKSGAILAVVEQAALRKDGLKAREAAGQLIDNFPGTSQAGYGALLSAKVQLETGDAKTAKAELTWAAEKASDQEVRDLARLRLATLLANEKSYDEALKQISAEPGTGFASVYAELRGDILALQGKKAEAGAAYKLALAGLAPKADQDTATAKLHEAAAAVLKVKLESVGIAGEAQ